MSDLYLHHYAASPFSEKIRLLLGYLDLEWNSVETSIIMPRPLLMPLTGGYRRIPVAQIGADVYCDTKRIARALAEHAGDDTLFAPGFAATRLADSADGELFRIAVALSFRPEAVAGLLAEGGEFGGVSMEAFAKDRAELTGGGDIAGIQPAEAESVLLHWLAELDASVPSGFLFGETPSIADFSVYHPLWFLRNNPVNAPSVEAHPNVSAWMGRVEAFGHGRAAPSDGQAALDHARSVAPRAVEGEVLGVAAEVGQTLRVTPTDYGRVPVEGVLLRADAQSFVVQRESDETGTIAVHFPRTGFVLDA